MMYQAGLPRQIVIATTPEPGDRPLTADPHTPHLVGDTTGQRLDTLDVRTPEFECVPSHSTTLAKIETRARHYVCERARSSVATFFEKFSKSLSILDSCVVIPTTAHNESASNNGEPPWNT